MTEHVLTINAGSSSVKFALYALDDRPVERLRGQVDGIGATPRIEARVGTEILADGDPLDPATDQAAALQQILRLIERRFGGVAIPAVGHRVVHGGVDYAAPMVLDAKVLADLERLVRLAPLHQPHNLAGIRAARAAFPQALQVACFDTAFHRAHPWVNDTFALPRSYYDEGVRRYGFHGISYEYVAMRLRAVAPARAAGRVAIAHLGNGASMCAVRDGRSVGSTMGFTALDGLPMGTRCGQLDPGVVLYMLDEKGMDAREIEAVLYKQSGLKGLSGLSHDMRELEAAGTPEAEEAIAYFVFRIRRELGAMAAILGGLDALVFCGGIGEHAWRVRERVCADMGWLGIALDRGRNRAGETVVSADESAVAVLVIRTDEEQMIAAHTAALLAASR